MKPIIRIIKFWLAVTWYTSIITGVIGGLIVTIEGVHNPIPLYWTKVSVDSIGTDHEIRLAATGDLLHNPEFWASTRQWPTSRHQWPTSIMAGYLAIRPPNFLWRLLWITTVLLGVGFMLIMIFLLRRLFRLLSAGTTFTLENATRIRRIGLLIFGGTLVENLLDFAQRFYLSRLVTTRGIEIYTDLDLDFSILFIGLVVLVIAEFFRHGVELEEERSLTV